MQFRVRRTSDWLGEKQPCPSAFRLPGDDKHWFVQLFSMADLEALFESVRDELIIHWFDLPTVEIYDDFRE